MTVMALAATTAVTVPPSVVLAIIPSPVAAIVTSTRGLGVASTRLFSHGMLRLAWTVAHGHMSTVVVTPIAAVAGAGASKCLWVTRLVPLGIISSWGGNRRACRLALTFTGVVAGGLLPRGVLCFLKGVKDTQVLVQRGHCLCCHGLKHPVPRHGWPQSAG